MLLWQLSKSFMIESPRKKMLNWSPCSHNGVFFTCSLFPILTFFACKREDDIHLLPVNVVLENQRRAHTIMAKIPITIKRTPPSFDMQPLLMNKQAANKKIARGGQASKIGLSNSPTLNHPLSNFVTYEAI